MLIPNLVKIRQFIENLLGWYDTDMVRVG